MEWKHTTPKNPKVGDIRFVRKFLWTPLRIGNRSRWLEWASWRETFLSYQVPITTHGYGFITKYKWVPTQWINRDD